MLTIHERTVSKSETNAKRWRHALVAICALSTTLLAGVVPAGAAEIPTSIEETFTAETTWGSIVADRKHQQVIYLNKAGTMSALNTNTGTVRTVPGDFLGDAMVSPDDNYLLAPYSNLTTAAVIDLRTFSIVHDNVNYYRYLEGTDAVQAWMWHELFSAPIGELPVFYDVWTDPSHSSVEGRAVLAAGIPAIPATS